MSTRVVISSGPAGGIQLTFRRAYSGASAGRWRAFGSPRHVSQILCPAAIASIQFVRRLSGAVRLRILRRFLVVAVLCVTAAWQPALAQENDPNVSPDNVEKLPSSRPIVEYALAGGFLLGA